MMEIETKRMKPNGESFKTTIKDDDDDEEDLSQEDQDFYDDEIACHMFEDE